MSLWGISVYILVILCLLCSHVNAEDEVFDSELNELIDGFDDSSGKQNNSDNFDSKNSRYEVPHDKESEWNLNDKWDVNSLLAFSSTYSYQRAKENQQPDYSGFSRFRVTVRPELRYTLTPDWRSSISGYFAYDAIFKIKGRSKYTDEILDEHELDAELWEAFLQGAISERLDIKLGRQIVVWGKSDTIRIVDVLNPLDQREPGMVDVEDLRLPVTMVKLDYYMQEWGVTLIVIPELRFNKLPAHNSDFSLPEKLLPRENISDGFSNLELAFALNGVFSMWDLSFYAAKIYDDEPYVVFTGSMPSSLSHSKIEMFGLATNVAYGNLLLKFESAYLRGLKLTNNTRTFSRSDNMIGIDYTSASTIISVEVANRHLLNYHEMLSQAPIRKEQDERQIVVRYEDKYKRDKIKFVALASLFGFELESGSFFRVSVEYELEEATHFEVGVILYESGKNAVMKQLSDNDRLFMDIKYRF